MGAMPVPVSHFQLFGDGEHRNGSRMIRFPAPGFRSAFLFLVSFAIATAGDYFISGEVKHLAVSSGTLVAVTTSPSAAHVTTNGASWTQSTQTFDGQGCYAVASAPGGFLAGDLSGATWDSADGLIWRGPYLTGGRSVSTIAFGPSGGFVGGSDAGGTRVWSTRDGKTFSSVFSQGQTGYIAGAAFGNNRWVVVGSRGGSPADRPLWLSGAAAGTALSEFTGPADAIAAQIAFGSGLFVAVTNKGLYSSPDGQVWTARSAPVPADVGVYSISYNEGQFVVTGGQGSVLKSADGIAWEVVSAPRANSTFSYDSGIFFKGVVVAGGFRLLTTFDGTVASLRIAQQPARQITSTSSVRLAIEAQGRGSLSYQWYRNGTTAISGATSAAYTVTTTGLYSVRVTDLTETLTSDTFAVFVGQPPVPTVAGTFAGSVGGLSTLTASLPNLDPKTYQWIKDGAVMVGSTGSSLPFSNLAHRDQGNYSVAVTTPYGAFVSVPRMLTVAGATPSSAAASKLANLSVRTTATTEVPLIVGFAIMGSARPLLLRAVGPTLAEFGVSGANPDSSMTLFASGGATLASNENWSAGADTANLIATAARVGAFALPGGSLDAALAPTLSPGVYTVHAKQQGAVGGVTLAEVYDANMSASGGLSNVSALSNAAAGDGALVAGFVVTGSLKKTVLIRGIGPALDAFGVGNALAQPVLKLISSDGTVRLTNDGWSAAPNASTISSKGGQIGAFALSGGSADCAMYVLIDPGAYTVSVTPAASGSGTALIEVYNID